ncbi:hypothetical protein ERHA55_29460 [Erwinia rhapontici]|uniref:Uncharacterized protein n=1 Tax=Erwinia rhapontici TaxID=55212 RepID=A0ABM7N1K1_ERWRD|nr:hypothetical protein [Erwinia rhapontici]BCQ35275.1 hypothetical protein ERHA53_26180 [Erwinia rhapontici]BCQ45419.1 hypothetical protein ERHA55_29460 [Erwinia rhapontici]
MLNILRSIADSISSSHYEKSFRQDYFTSNLTYFTSLLGNRLNTRTSLIESDMPILKEAYDKAHQKAQFEIDLHWRRTTHIWTLILALLVATGTVSGLFLTAKSEQKDLFAVVTLIISIISMVASKTSISMLKVSHKWCRNWELHVVMLEPLFSGRLYQTHLGIGKTRLSMAKLNNVFIWIAFSCWIATFQISILILSSNLKNFVITTFITYSSISVMSIIIGHAISSKDEDNTTYELTQYGISPTVHNSNTTYLMQNLKVIGKQLIYGIAIIISIIISMYLLINSVSEVDISFHEFSYFMNQSIKTLIPALF